MQLAVAQLRGNTLLRDGNQGDVIVAAPEQVFRIVEARSGKPLRPRHLIGALYALRGPVEVDAGKLGIEAPKRLPVVH